MTAPALVLVVDDDPRFRRFARQALADGGGFDVIEIEDGDTALEFLTEAADGNAPMPDVIVLDCLLPGYSGLGVLQLLRRLGVKVSATVLVTGFPDGSVDLLASRLGARQVLHKPVDVDELRAAVVEASKRPA